MRRLLVAAAVAAAVAVPAAPALAYDRRCGGAIDYECNGTVCPMDCFPGECLLWIDLFHEPSSARCVEPLPVG